MSSPARIVPILIAAATLDGCAGYRLTPISSDQPDPLHEGYVFYAPAPFLLGTLQNATTASLPQYDFKLVYLPDRARPYRFTRYEFLAKSDLKITFAEGWQFTGADSQTDTTAALSALVDLAKLAAGMRVAQNNAPPTFLLFQIAGDAGAKQYRLQPIDFAP